MLCTYLVFVYHVVQCMSCVHISSVTIRVATFNCNVFHTEVCIIRTTYVILCVCYLNLCNSTTTLYNETTGKVFFDEGTFYSH